MSACLSHNTKAINENLTMMKIDNLNEIYGKFDPLLPADMQKLLSPRDGFKVDCQRRLKDTSKQIKLI